MLKYAVEGSEKNNIDKKSQLFIHKGKSNKNIASCKIHGLESVKSKFIEGWYWFHFNWFYFYFLHQCDAEIGIGICNWCTFAIKNLSEFELYYNITKQVTKYKWRIQQTFICVILGFFLFNQFFRILCLTLFNLGKTFDQESTCNTETAVYSIYNINNA